MKLQIIIELKSALLLGSGTGHGAFIDTDIIYDDNGIPYFPGRRLKGLLRESADEVMEMLTQANLAGFISSDVNSVFGTGLNSSAITVSNLELEGYRESQAVLQTARNAYPHLVNQNTVLHSLTGIRQQTAVNEKGIAKPNSLRTIRVMKPKSSLKENGSTIPRRFVGEIGVRDESSIRLLALSCSNLRLAGSKRNRGLGSITVTLVDEHQNDLTAQVLSDLEKHIASPDPEKHEKSPLKDDIKRKPSVYAKGTPGKAGLSIPYRVFTRSPLIFTTRGSDSNIVRTLDYVPGSAILGFFASEYLRRIHLTPAEAHQDGTFRRWFIEGGLRFSNGYYCPLDEEGNLLETIPTPLYIQVYKHSSDIVNLFNHDADDTKPLGGYCYVNGTSLFSASPHKNISFHLRRNTGNDNRWRGSSAIDGDIFNYESISAGQYFAGTIIGSEEDIRQFVAVFSEGQDTTDGFSLTGRIGRSSNTQYGEIELNLLPPREVSSMSMSPYLLKGLHAAETDNADGEFIMVFTSPAILRNQYGYPEISLDALNRYLRQVSDRLHVLHPERLDDDSITTCFARIESREKFVSHWKNKMPGVLALSPGSAFRVKVTGGIDQEILEVINQLQTAGLGEQLNEGYGQVRCYFELEDYTADQPATDRGLFRVQTTVPALAKEIFTGIINRRLAEVISFHARSMAEKPYTRQEPGVPRKAPSSSLLGRLELMLQDSTSIEDFQAKIRNLKKEALDQLQGCSLGRENLKDLLLKPNCPYLLEALMSYAMTDARDLAEKTSIKISPLQFESFTLYWRVFFHTLRKLDKENKLIQPTSAEGGEAHDR